jgi:hypothetical protein
MSAQTESSSDWWLWLWGVVGATPLTVIIVIAVGVADCSLCGSLLTDAAIRSWPGLPYFSIPTRVSTPDPSLAAKL